MTERNVSVRLQAVGGDKVKAEFAQIGNIGGRALRGIEGQSQRTGMQLQNAAFQVGDFFVQVNSGTSATRAMAQQLPQLLGAFGLFGALAGAAFAALSPFIGKMFEGEDAAKALAESLKALESATREYEAAAKSAQVPVKELREKYRELADEIKHARDMKLELARIEAEGAMDASIKGITGKVLGDTGLLRSNEALAALDTGLDALIAKSDRLYQELAQGGGSAAAFADLTATDQAIGALQSVKGQVDDLAKSYGITADEAVRLAMAANDLYDAGSLEERATAADAMAAELIDVFGSIEAVNAAMPGMIDALATAAEEAGNLSAAAPDGSWLDAAIGGRGRWRRSCGKPPVQRRRRLMPRRGTQPGPSRHSRRGAGPCAASRAPSGIGGVDWGAAPGSSSRGGGGGGGGVDPRLREAERWFDRTRTAAERYAEELADLNELQKLGYLDADTYGRAVKEIGEAYGEAGDQAKFFEGLQQELKDGFLDAIVSGEDLAGVFEQLAKSIARAALEAALFNTGPFAGGGGGSGLLGGIFGSLFGGFRASGGPVSGGRAYVVGERGPELMVPGFSGTVIPNDALRGGARVELVIRKEPGVVAEIARTEAVKVTQAGLGEYDRRVLPQSITRYQRDSRARG